MRLGLVLNPYRCRRCRRRGGTRRPENFLGEYARVGSSHSVVVTANDEASLSRQACKSASPTVRGPAQLWTTNQDRSIPASARLIADAQTIDRGIGQFGISNRPVEVPEPC